MIAVAVLLLLVAAVVLRFHSAGQLDAQYWEFFAWSTTWSFLAKGLLGTLASAAMAAVIALALGLLLLLGRLSRLRLVRWPSIAVIEFLRGTPTLLLIYVLSGAAVSRDQAEHLLDADLAHRPEYRRRGRRGLPCRRACRTPRPDRCGAKPGADRSPGFFFIVFPQALRYIVPALVAQLVIVVKDTTFGYVVTYGELMQNGKVLIANYHSLVPVYLVVAALYCLVNYAISRASKRLGRPMH